MRSPLCLESWENCWHLSHICDKAGQTGWLLLLLVSCHQATWGWHQRSWSVLSYGSMSWSAAQYTMTASTNEEPDGSHPSENSTVTIVAVRSLQIFSPDVRWRAPGHSEGARFWNSTIFHLCLSDESMQTSGPGWWRSRHPAIELWTGSLPVLPVFICTLALLFQSEKRQNLVISLWRLDWR